jgi:hypothetical protein
VKKFDFRLTFQSNLRNGKNGIFSLIKTYYNLFFVATALATSTPTSSIDASRTSTALDYSAISAISYEERNVTVKMVYDKVKEIKIQLNDLSN